MMKLCGNCEDYRGDGDVPMNGHGCVQVGVGRFANRPYGIKRQESENGVSSEEGKKMKERSIRTRALNYAYFQRMVRPCAHSDSILFQGKTRNNSTE